jgi:hypothetical protein
MKIFLWNLVFIIVHFQILMFSSAPSGKSHEITSKRPGPPCYNYFQITIHPTFRHIKTSSRVHNSYVVIPLCIYSVVEHSTGYFARTLPFDAVLCEFLDGFFLKVANWAFLRHCSLE